MVITLTPAQFNNLKKIIAVGNTSMPESQEGELLIELNGQTDSIKWKSDEVQITIE